MTLSGLLAKIAHPAIVHVCILKLLIIFTVTVEQGLAISASHKPRCIYGRPTMGAFLSPQIQLSQCSLLGIDLLFTIKTMFGSNSRRAAPSDWLVPKSRRPNSALSNWWRAVIALDRAPRAAAWGAFFSPPGLSFTITTIERPSQLKFGKAHS